MYSMFLKLFSPNPSLRFGLELCPDETKFLSDRKLHIFHGLNVFLGRAKGPRNGSEVNYQSHGHSKNDDLFL